MCVSVFVFCVWFVCVSDYKNTSVMVYVCIDLDSYLCVDLLLSDKIKYILCLTEYRHLSSEYPI